MRFLDRIHNDPDSRLDTIKKMIQLNLPIMIYGAGVNALYTVKFLKRFGLSPTCFCDDDTTKTEFLGKPVYTHEQFINQRVEYHYVVIAIHQKNSDVYQKLLPYHKHIARCLYPDDIFSNTTTNYQFVLSFQDEFEKLYNSLDDALSRDTLVNLINYKISGNTVYLNRIYQPNTYFDSVVKPLLENEVFVDCGAFDGDSIFRFIGNLDKNYRKIIGFEPDIETYQTLKENTSKLNNIELYNAGVWHETSGRVGFNQTGLPCSATLEDLSTNIDVYSIDDIIEDKVTFIKMDVEGAEMQALQGAVKTIQRDKPKLAICVYHRKEDILALPKFIKSIVPSYKLYLRHHAYISSDETVLYAI